MVALTVDALLLPTSGEYRSVHQGERHGGNSLSRPRSPRRNPLPERWAGGEGAIGVRGSPGQAGGVEPLSVAGRVVRSTAGERGEGIPVRIRLIPASQLSGRGGAAAARNIHGRLYAV